MSQPKRAELAENTRRILQIAPVVLAELDRRTRFARETDRARLLEMLEEIDDVAAGCRERAEAIRDELEGEG